MASVIAELLLSLIFRAKRFKYKNVAIANRLRVSCTHNMSRASMITP